MDEIGTEAKLDGGLGAKVEMCTPVHGLSVCLITEKPESPCTGVHIFNFAHKPRPIWLLYQSRPISISSLNKLVERTVRTVCITKCRTPTRRTHVSSQFHFRAAHDCHHPPGASCLTRLPYAYLLPMTFGLLFHSLGKRSSNELSCSTSSRPPYCSVTLLEF